MISKLLDRLWEKEWFVNIARWFYPWWWGYLLKGCTGWTNFWCRVGGHKCGIYFYNPGGLEPDWHCRNCEEDLG